MRISSLVSLIAIATAAGCRSPRAVQPTPLAESAAPAESTVPAESPLPAESTPAADNVLSSSEAAAGWILLFDGKTLDGWMTSGGRPSATPHEKGLAQGSINPHGCGDYMLVHREPLSDFILSLDFKISPGCNSGIFVRTHSLTPRPGKDVGFNGIEIAIDDTRSAGYHDTGAIYDLAAPWRNAMRPAGQWNSARITCVGSCIAVELNGEIVNAIDLDRWTAPNVRPDGTPHKFDVAYREHPRTGYLGLQDHGADVWFKNIKLREL